MSKISATIVADSLSPHGQHRATSILGVIPRIVLAELNTHRMFSRNSASSRAIPFKKMVESVRKDPFIPIAFQKEHKGMQGTEYLEGSKLKKAIWWWKVAIKIIIWVATRLNKIGVTKQLANRLLEPFMWHTVLITATEWENFFKLRGSKYVSNAHMEEQVYRSRKDIIKELSGVPADDTLFWLKQNTGAAEIHIREFAECVWDAMNESTPKQLKEGEWHIPFEDKINANTMVNQVLSEGPSHDIFHLEDVTQTKVKVSTAMGARTSYTVVGNEKEVSYKRLVEIHDELIVADPLHASPMEHPLRAMTEIEYNSFVKGNLVDAIKDKNNTNGWCYNMQGFIPYRYLIENNQSL